MSRVRVEMVFDGSPAQVRDVVEAMRDGLLRAQRAGRYEDVRLTAGPSLSSSWPEPVLSIADYLERSATA